MIEHKLKAEYSFESIDELNKAHRIPVWKWSNLLPWKWRFIKEYYDTLKANREMINEMCKEIVKGFETE